MLLQNGYSYMWTLHKCAVIITPTGSIDQICYMYGLIFSSISELCCWIMAKKLFKLWCNSNIHFIQLGYEMLSLHYFILLDILESLVFIIEIKNPINFRQIKESTSWCSWNMSMRMGWITQPSLRHDKEEVKKCCGRATSGMLLEWTAQHLVEQRILSRIKLSSGGYGKSGV